MRLAALVLLLSAVLPAEIRLSEVKTVYVAPLGEGEDAAMWREGFVTRLAGTAKVKVVDSPEQSDGRILGMVQIRRSQQGMIWGGMAAAGEVTRATVVLRLMDKDGNCIWTYDSTQDNREKGAAKSLVEAIDKDKKKH